MPLQRHSFFPLASLTTRAVPLHVPFLFGLFLPKYGAERPRTNGASSLISRRRHAFQEALGGTSMDGRRWRYILTSSIACLPRIARRRLVLIPGVAAVSAASD